jgi:8-oxo-dGTP pyrophosphatase MutT (NUDIX family)
VVGRQLRIEDAVSAGGLVWRRAAQGGIEVVLCGRRSEQLWGLPKGTPDANESLEETALREVQEETGLQVQRGLPLGTIEYWFTGKGVRYHKRVHHWLMEPIGGDVANHDHEYDDVEWMPIERAYATATYENERRIIAEGARLLGAPL